MTAASGKAEGGAGELEPCPFCGGEAVTQFSRLDGGGNPVPPYYAGCTSCKVFFTELSKPRAIAAWNRRATPQSLGEAVTVPRELIVTARKLVDFINNEGPPAMEWEAISLETERLDALLTAVIDAAHPADAVTVPREPATIRDSSYRNITRLSDAIAYIDALKAALTGAKGE